MEIDDFKSGRELLDQNKRCTNLDLDLGLRPPKNTLSKEDTVLIDGVGRSDAYIGLHQGFWF